MIFFKDLQKVKEVEGYNVYVSENEALKLNPALYVNFSDDTVGMVIYKVFYENNSDETIRAAILHELGHLKNNHSTSTPTSIEELNQREFEADSYAASICGKE